MYFDRRALYLRGTHLKVSFERCLLYMFYMPTAELRHELLSSADRRTAALGPMLPLGVTIEVPSL